jgi:hypothetical protein
MYARVEYPLFFLEVYLSESEREILLKFGKLEGELESLLRVFPAFDKGNLGFMSETSKLKIELGRDYSLNSIGLDLTLTLDRKKLEQNEWNVISNRRKGMHVYFNKI